MFNPPRCAFVSQVVEVRLRLCKTEVSPRNVRPKIRFSASPPLDDRRVRCVYKLLFVFIKMRCPK